MSNLYSTKQKISIANAVIKHACGDKTALGYNEPILTRLHKIEKKYLKSKSYDLSDFAICLSELPPMHLGLMRTICWLDPETEGPQKYLDGFYSEAYGSKPGVTQINHYITIDTYIHLLFIELQLTDMYSKYKSQLAE